MDQKKQESPRQNVENCRAALQVMSDGGNEHGMSIASANLGFALFQVRNFEEGVAQFDGAINLANKLQDISLQVRILGIKTLAFQLIGRLPDAFVVAGEILKLGESHGDMGFKCDALASQGQILLDSGEPIIAFDKLKAAREIATEIDDKRRLMNVLGALGNYSLAITSLDQSQAYFEKALGLAISLEDKRAEIGFRGNQAAVMAWQGNHAQAAPLFEQVLILIQDQENMEATIQAIRHLVNCYAKLKDDNKVVEYSLRGIEHAKDVDADATLNFYEALIAAYYRTNYYDQAHVMTQRVIELAQKAQNQSKTVDLLLGLGESQFLVKNFDEALIAYKEAVLGAKELGRLKDEAYLTGRIGATLAELGELESAVGYHQQAINLARNLDISALEGEQLSMLALAYFELKNYENARENCQSAIKVYLSADLKEESERARRLLEEIACINPALVG